MYDTWNDHAYPCIQKIAGSDKFYQELSERAEQKWVELQSVRQKLTPEEWEMLEDYIACCEDLEYRFAQLAYEFGKCPY